MKIDEFAIHLQSKYLGLTLAEAFELEMFGDMPHGEEQRQGRKVQYLPETKQQKIVRRKAGKK